MRALLLTEGVPQLLAWGSRGAEGEALGRALRTFAEGEAGQG